MAKPYFVGAAIARAQVDTLTVGGTVEIGDKFKVTLTAEDGTSTQTLTVPSTTTSTATTASEIVTAFNNAADPNHSTFLGLFQNITAALNGSTVLLTANVAGVPFSCSVTTTETDDSPADAQTFTRGATTTNRGPNDWNSLDNWSTGALPVSTDEVILDGRANGVHILYGLNQNGVTLAHLDIRPSFSGDVGQFVNITGLTVKNFKLRISATILTIGQTDDGGTSAPNTGSRLLNIDVGSNVSAMRILGTATSSRIAGLPPVMLKGTHASNTLTISGSSFVGAGVATPGESSTLATTINSSSGGLLTLGTGLTLADVTNNGLGSVTITNTAITGTLKVVTGVVHTYGAVNIATLDVRENATCYLNNRPAAGAAVTTQKLIGGTVNSSRDARTFTVTATTVLTGKYQFIAATRAQVTFTDGAIALSETASAQGSQS